jgi:hypothetical protein
MVATTMLNTYFLLHKPTPDVLQAVSYYMDILVQYQNYSNANLKAAFLPMLIGYWSNEKIIEIAQKNFNAPNRRTTTAQYLQDYYQKLLKETVNTSTEQSAQTSAAQYAAKFQAGLQAKATSFPKRSAPYPDAISQQKEFLQLKQETPESVAILAFLAEGKFVSDTNNK